MKPECCIEGLCEAVVVKGVEMGRPVRVDSVEGQASDVAVQIHADPLRAGASVGYRLALPSMPSHVLTLGTFQTPGHSVVADHRAAVSVVLVCAFVRHTSVDVPAALELPVEALLAQRLGAEDLMQGLEAVGVLGVRLLLRHPRRSLAPVRQTQLLMGRVPVQAESDWVCWGKDNTYMGPGAEGNHICMSIYISVSQLMNK